MTVPNIVSLDDPNSTKLNQNLGLLKFKDILPCLSSLDHPSVENPYTVGFMSLLGELLD